MDFYKLSPLPDTEPELPITLSLWSTQNHLVTMTTIANGLRFVLAAYGDQQVYVLSSYPELRQATGTLILLAISPDFQIVPADDK